MEKQYHILVCCDENYIPPLRTMLYSLFMHTVEGLFTIHLIHSRISEETLEKLEAYVLRVSKGRAVLENHRIGNEFDEEKVNFYYSVEMYYRLLAFEILPKEVKKVLYIDPDTLIINSIDELWNIDMNGNLFAAAPHKLPLVQEFNVSRLKGATSIEIDYYYNSGVLLMDLDAQRKENSKDSILEYIQKAPQVAQIMPDQDLLNVVFSKMILPIDEKKYNYDSRRYEVYRLDNPEWDITKIMSSTVIIHFCGKKKPWNNGAIGKFVTLYRYFQNKAISEYQLIDNK